VGIWSARPTWPREASHGPWGHYLGCGMTAEISGKAECCSSWAFWQNAEVTRWPNPLMSPPWALDDRCGQREVKNAHAVNPTRDLAPEAGQLRLT